jgi:hypothetical protein
VVTVVPASPPDPPWPLLVEVVAVAELPPWPEPPWPDEEAESIVEALELAVVEVEVVVSSPPQATSASAAAPANESKVLVVIVESFQVSRG